MLSTVDMVVLRVVASEGRRVVAYDATALAGYANLMTMMMMMMRATSDSPKCETFIVER